MGIPGLLPVLKAITENVGLEEYRGLTVGVDAYCWLHRGAYSCGEELCRGIETDKYITVCMKRVALLQAHGIMPLLVFDGASLPAKRGQNRSRREARQASLDKATAALAAGEVAAARQHYTRAVEVTTAMARRLMAELRRAGVAFMVAPYEADAQLAYLSKHGLVDAVITEDSDSLPYGCKRVIFKLDNDGKGQQIQRRNLPANQPLLFNSWTNGMFLDMCLLTGCDYLPSISGLGIVTAHRLVARHRTFEAALAAMRQAGRFDLPEGFEALCARARLTFCHQCIYDPRERRADHLAPLRSRAAALLEESGGDLGFLGALPPPQVAEAVAKGMAHPSTHEPYPDDLPSHLQLRVPAAEAVAATAEAVAAAAQAGPGAAEDCPSGAQAEGRESQYRDDVAVPLEPGRLSTAAVKTGSGGDSVSGGGGGGGGGFCEGLGASFGASAAGLRCDENTPPEAPEFAAADSAVATAEPYPATSSQPAPGIARRFLERLAVAFASPAGKATAAGSAREGVASAVQKTPLLVTAEGPPLPLPSPYAASLDTFVEPPLQERRASGKGGNGGGCDEGDVSVFAPIWRAGGPFGGDAARPAPTPPPPQSPYPEPPARQRNNDTGAALVADAVEKGAFAWRLALPQPPVPAGTAVAAAASRTARLPQVNAGAVETLLAYSGVSDGGGGAATSGRGAVAPRGFIPLSAHGFSSSRVGSGFETLRRRKRRTGNAGLDGASVDGETGGASAATAAAMAATEGEDFGGGDCGDGGVGGAKLLASLEQRREGQDIGENEDGQLGDSFTAGMTSGPPPWSTKAASFAVAAGPLPLGGVPALWARSAAKAGDSSCVGRCDGSISAGYDTVTSTPGNDKHGGYYEGGGSSRAADKMLTASHETAFMAQQPDWSSGQAVASPIICFPRFQRGYSGPGPWGASGAYNGGGAAAIVAAAAAAAAAAPPSPVGQLHAPPPPPAAALPGLFAPLRSYAVSSTAIPAPLLRYLGPDGSSAAAGSRFSGAPVAKKRASEDYWDRRLSER